MKNSENDKKKIEDINDLIINTQLNNKGNN